MCGIHHNPQEHKVEAYHTWTYAGDPKYFPYEGQKCDCGSTKWITEPPEEKEYCTCDNPLNSGIHSHCARCNKPLPPKPEKIEELKGIDSYQMADKLNEVIRKLND